MDAIALQEQLQEKWIVFFFALVWSAVACRVAARKGLFSPFTASSEPAIKGMDVFTGFGLYFLVQILIVSVFSGIIALTAQIYTGSTDNILPNTLLGKSLLNLFTVIGAFIGVFIAYKILSKEQRQQMMNQTKDSWMDQLLFGIATWFVIAPIVLAVSQLISIIITYFYPHEAIDQVAIQVLKKSTQFPFLFGLTFLSIAFLVPFTEEYLFRGILQNWFKQRFNNIYGGILFSSLTFTAFHFSTSQGLTNFELLLPIFVFSCFLGFLYERQKSLWAPMGLHGIFNFLSMLLIFNE